MLLTIKNYVFYIDTNSTIHFSALADISQPVRKSSFPINKRNNNSNNLISRLLQKLAKKRQNAIEDYINTLLP
ncbi:TPA: hypothetical protein ACO6US_003796 [Escherichia albertii]|uniref:hypothetical protein n=1 Tax=Escherichia albertii TaxID=208962 RepID=UPI000743B9AD|nr:hypothetical protein [Escherichia albertii]EEX4923873.1 hypothetical protein [Escherichia albertii]EFO1265970.1 hypothetical protein [Escherichia albertii]MCZ9122221.1 hypothetical protein [Escherichia albertii]